MLENVFHIFKLYGLLISLTHVIFKLASLSKLSCNPKGRVCWLFKVSQMFALPRRILRVGRAYVPEAL